MLRKDMVESLGMERTRKMFTRFGYYWGQADAAAMARIFQWKDIAEWIKAGPRMHSLQGVAHAVIKSLEIDAEKGRLCMEVLWRSSGEADEHLLTLGKSDVPICWMLTGYASGYASFCLGRDVYFVEQTCQGQGDKICSAIGMGIHQTGSLMHSNRRFSSEKIFESGGLVRGHISCGSRVPFHCLSPSTQWVSG